MDHRFWLAILIVTLFISWRLFRKHNILKVIKSKKRQKILKIALAIILIGLLSGIIYFVAFSNSQYAYEDHKNLFQFSPIDVFKGLESERFEEGGLFSIGEKIPLNGKVKEIKQRIYSGRDSLGQIVPEYSHPDSHLHDFDYHNYDAEINKNGVVTNFIRYVSEIKMEESFDYIGGKLVESNYSVILGDFIEPSNFRHFYEDDFLIETVEVGYSNNDTVKYVYKYKYDDKYRLKSKTFYLFDANKNNFFASGSQIFIYNEKYRTLVFEDYKQKDLVGKEVQYHSKRKKPVKITYEEYNNERVSVDTFLLDYYFNGTLRTWKQLPTPESDELLIEYDRKGRIVKKSEGYRVKEFSFNSNGDLELIRNLSDDEEVDRTTYEYVYDSQNNWIECNVFNQSDIIKIIREISYY